MPSRHFAAEILHKPNYNDLPCSNIWAPSLKALNVSCIPRRYDSVRATRRTGRAARHASKCLQDSTSAIRHCLYIDCNYRARRIKCDEGRPTCRRCLTSKRDCVYIDTPPAAKAPQYALLLPKPVRLLQCILPSMPAGFGQPDVMNIEFFRLHTIDELPGRELEIPWRNILFPDGQSEPVISYAIAALGCMHRAQGKSLPSSSPDDNHGTEPYELYNKAVVALRKYIDRAPEVGLVVASETTLVAIMLLFCFEVLSGNDHYASKHLMAAFTILAKKPGHHTNDTWAPGTLVLGSSNAPRTDALVHLFLRLASDWIVSGPFYYGGCESPLQAICKDPMPHQFQSVKDASIHLDTLCCDASKHDEHLFDKADHFLRLQRGGKDSTTSHQCEQFCLVLATSRTLELDADSAFQLDVNATIAALVRWRAAFAALLSSQPWSNSVLLLEAQYLQTWILLHIMHDFDQTLCDSLEEDFQRAIDIAETYLLQEPTSTSGADSVHRSLWNLSNLGNNLASTICIVIEKCRSSRIRWRGVELLKAFDLRGIFDTPYLVAYYQHLVSEEEMRARELQPTTLLGLKCSDVPQQARFVDTFMCFCDSEQEGEEFYRRSYGSMLYVVNSGHSGALETGQSSFFVHRDAPSVAMA